MSEQRKHVQIALRLPPAMHGTIKALAERERRSLHAQLLILLDEALEARASAEDPRGKLAA